MDIPFSTVNMMGSCISAVRRQCIAATLLGAAYAQNSPLPTVDLGYEIYQASAVNNTGNFYKFGNIRYAAPPVGDLRFAPPQAPAVNRSTIKNDDVPKSCPQMMPEWLSYSERAIIANELGMGIPNETFVVSEANSTSPVPKPTSLLQSEDCLFLDVYVPEDVLSKAGQGYGAPVLIWIYGGGYTAGTKGDYTAAGLFAASGNSSNGDFIYIALNYRIGAMGWMGGPSYQAEGGVSNLGLYDQRFALEWVQDNIHLFGGDKNRVTVFGESAGGGSIVHQITAYGGSKGPVPFQQAVPQSPGWLPISSQVVQENTYQKFLNLTKTTSLAELRALPSEKIIEANARQVFYDSLYGSFTYGPVVDGYFVPLQPGQLLAQGRFDKDVRVMVGHNADEGYLFTPQTIRTEQQVVDQLTSSFANVPQKSIDYILSTLYPAVFDGSLPYTSNVARANFITSEAIFTCNTNYLSTAFGNRTYSYLFAVPPAIHGQDVPYTYYDGGAVADQANPGRSVANRTIAIALQEYITNFAKIGSPDGEGVPVFNMYGKDASVLKLNISGIDEVRDTNANARCAWWQKALY
ncbi:alpha/beta-hydrolase [Clathrospora elynae]|uniref:Carboxylic ester hydrolase n=1 Tax=Clathrospora elynae TaxID=706981 RepID=A0A6A5T1G6_9PLEO|nr:alpha/beta-hydrolase [Clathrospora elynae]